MTPTRFRPEPLACNAGPHPSGDGARLGGRDVVDSRSLFRSDASTVAISHGDTLYTLRITRDNKLILTK